MGETGNHPRPQMSGGAGKRSEAEALRSVLKKLQEEVAEK